jgi:cytochrome bd-type quinol oxidase subunit 2
MGHDRRKFLVCGKVSKFNANVFIDKFLEFCGPYWGFGIRIGEGIKHLHKYKFIFNSPFNKMRTITYTQILSILCSSIGLIFHLKAVLREKDSSEKDKKDRQIARRATLLSILFLGITYGLILYNWDGYPSPKHEVQINFFHIMIVLLPISVIELLVAQKIL